MTQYYSRVTYQGGSDIFTIPFDYINKRHIKVYLDDIELENSAEGYTFLNATQIQIHTEIPIGTEILIKRVTPIDNKIVTYRDTSMVLDDKNLNLSQDQLLNAVQEIYDDNEIFKHNMTEQQSDFEDSITTQQAGFETSITNQQNNFEDSITTRQNNYETNLTNKFNILKRGVTTYVHTQAEASDTWVIEHNLNKMPSITLIDQFGKEFDAEKEYPTGYETTKVIIHLNGATTGKALLN